MNAHDNTQNDLTLLGFDYGSKSIGIAIGQTLINSARPLGAARAENGAPDWQPIDKLVKTWKPDAMVIGIPLNMDGTEQNTTREAKAFAQALRERFPSISVHETDERLTTVEARNQIFDEKGYRGLKKADIDALSAALILEEWMHKKTS